MVSMMATMGKNGAITINPTTTARKTIAIGSISGHPITTCPRPHRRLSAIRVSILGNSPVSSPISTILATKTKENLFPFPSAL